MSGIIFGQERTMSDLRTTIADVIYDATDLATSASLRVADAILALPEIERLRATPCPYVRQADEGTAYCSLAERQTT